jgi:hypothetical protein
MNRSTTMFLCAALGAALPAEPPDNAQELGRVRWGRDLDAALAASVETAKPVFLLFQEIPGCQTCVDFGQSPLSHPLLVEAIETEFVPVAIYNNRPGKDAAMLERYDEPAWNYPVMRFLDAKGKDIVPRRDRIWETGPVAERLIEALKAAGRPVPEYLRLAAVETAPRQTAKATFAMHCYWDGEAQLGSIEGVVRTRAGWVGSDEVVEVVYDPDVLGYEKLVNAARQRQCATKIYAHDEQQLETARALAGGIAAGLDAPARSAKASDQKFALRHCELRYLPLTPMQATKVNADLRSGKDPARWLSPRQRELVEAVRRAVAKDEDALRGLERPDSLTQLAAYEDELRARLADL